ncbi:MAG: phosphate-starvation-inducible PsiE family protein [Arcobacteraceae bacterium]|jgi:uncharacterized membrane protein (DUF373 family)|nr:phosphate-starvation-inducible PsiE family protein [Arcobacteraceae bacterium]
MLFQNLIKKIQYFFSMKFYIEVVVAVVLFIYAMTSGSMVDIIVSLLYFIILLEIVRAVIGFIREQRIKIRFLIDAFIILALREFIVNVVKINNENINGIDALFSNSTNFHILVFSGVLIFLFILRWLAHLTSPDKQCKNE